MCGQKDKNDECHLEKYQVLLRTFVLWSLLGLTEALKGGWWDFCGGFRPPQSVWEPLGREEGGGQGPHEAEGSRPQPLGLCRGLSLQPGLGGLREPARRQSQQRHGEGLGTGCCLSWTLPHPVCSVLELLPGTLPSGIALFPFLTSFGAENKTQRHGQGLGYFDPKLLLLWTL